MKKLITTLKLLVLANVVCDLAIWRLAAELNNQPDRLSIVVLGFEIKENQNILTPWKLVAEDITIAGLKRVSSLYVVPESSVDYALHKMNLPHKTPITQIQAQKLGGLINAQRVVWGSIQRENEKWQITARVLDVGTGYLSNELKASSTNLAKTSGQLVDKILQELQITPSGDQHRRFVQHYTDSSESLEWFGKAKAYASEGKSLLEQEDCYRHALETDPKFTPAYDYLSAMLCSEGKWDDAEKVARDALKLDPADAGAHKAIGASLWIHGDNLGAEKELQMAGRLDPDDGDTFAHLGYLFYAQSRLSEAIDAYKKSLLLAPYASNAASIRAQLGYLYALQGNREQATNELNEISRNSFVTDSWGEQNLGNAYQTLGDMVSAIQHYERFIALANESSVNSEQIDSVKKFVQEWKPRLTPFYITNTPPRDFNEQTLKKKLHEKFTPDELRLIVNPLTSNVDMDLVARRLVAGATNDMQKAKILFTAICQHVSNDQPLSYRHSVTAQEAFAEWNRSGTFLHCQEAAFLFVAWARAVGIKSYAVSVEEACDGSKTPHGCAVVYIGDKILLVDPAFFWFGAPHKRFSVLDDLETIGVYLSTLANLKQNQIAVKLAPKVALVQCNLCYELIREERWTEAYELLPLIKRLDKSDALVCSLQAFFYMHDGQAEAAIESIRAAIQIDPHSFFLRAQLGNAYALQNKFGEARESFEKALNCPHTKDEAEEISKVLNRIKTKQRITQ